MKRSIIPVAALILLGGAGKARADGFEVLSYNTWMRPVIIFPTEMQQKRAQLLPQKLAGYDVVVLQELFDTSARATVLEGLAAQGYRYTTHRLGRDGLFIKDGGVVIASRWPIVAEAQRLFRSCANTNLCIGDQCLVGDCDARKGVLYACVEKHGRRYHVFGSHMQSSDLPAAREARARQMRTIRAFIDSRQIPADEPVIVAGDLNVDSVGGAAEFRSLLQVLGASPPRLRAGLPFSDDPETNTWDREDSPDSRRKVIDHILISDAHLRPSRAVFGVRVVRSGGLDLSDHHAVYARLEFPSMREVARASSARPARSTQ